MRLVGTSPRRCENLVRPLNAAPRAPRDTIHVRRQCVRTRCAATRSSTPAAWRCRLDCTPFHLHHPSSSAAPCCPATRALQRGWRSRVSRRAFPVAKRRRALAGMLCAPAPPAAAADAPSCPHRLRATHAYPRIERAAAGARGESSGAVFVDTRVHTFTLCSSSRRAHIGCPASAEHQRAAVVAGARKDGGKRGGMPLTGLPACAQAAAPAFLVRQKVQAHAFAAGPRSNRASSRKARLQRRRAATTVRFAALRTAGATHNRCRSARLARPPRAAARHVHIGRSGDH